MNFLLALGLLAQVTYAAAATSTIAMTSPLSIEQMIDSSADRYGVASSTLNRVLSCESSLDAGAIGDHGESYGIAQIYLPDHPEISVFQALDPAFSIDYLAEQISEGNGYLWTCYRELMLSTAPLADESESE